MARIRSIKPEFWTDGTNLDLSDSCALFFIGLWNFCDDEGKHPLNLNQLVAELGGRWHRGKVKLYLSCLVKSGQLRINSDSTWIQVTGWSHQKIDKPKQPSVKNEDLQWLSQTDSANEIDKSLGIDARIGSDRRDRIGSELRKERTPKKSESDLNEELDFGDEPASQDEPPLVLKGTVVSRCVAEYHSLWATLYEGRAPCMPKERKALERISNELGETRTIQLLKAYFEMPERWFVEKRHDLITLESNLNKVSHFADTGAVISTAVNHAQTRSQGNQAALAAYKKRLKTKENAV